MLLLSRQWQQLRHRTRKSLNSRCFSILNATNHGTNTEFPPTNLLFDIDELPSSSSSASTFSSVNDCYRYQSCPPFPLFPISHSKPRIAVALSGGVDSSVAAFLLHESGYSVSGIYMQNWDELDELGECSGEQDLIDAQRVSTYLKLESFHQINFVAEYWNLIFNDLLQGYKAGYTPNPDVLCNREIKFQLLLQHIQENMGIPILATGHYARTQRIYHSDSQTTNGEQSSRTQKQQEIDIGKIPYKKTTPRYDINQALKYVDSLTRNSTSTTADSILSLPFLSTSSTSFSSLFNPNYPSLTTRLLTGIDRIKDQTYFLSLIRPSSLPHLLFPLGSLTKSLTRSIARYAGLSTATKADSMGICMIGRRKFAAFLAEYLTLTPGQFINLQGEILATHRGIEQYTIGQSALIGGMHKKWYVAAKDLESGNITIVDHRFHPALLHDTIIINKINWLNDQIPTVLLEGGEFYCYCRLRSSEKLRRCKITINDSNAASAHSAASIIHATSDLSTLHSYTVTFVDFPHHLVSPGQTCVFYIEDCCLGGGPIAAAGPSYLELRKTYQMPIYQTHETPAQCGIQQSA